MNLIYEKVPRIRWYSDLTPFVEALACRVHDYTWRFDAVEGVAPPQGKECDDYWVLTGSEFGALVADHPQFIWAVISAIPNHFSDTQIHAQCEPYADGNPTFWTGTPRPQHPFAEFEIVCWDASATLIIGADEAIATAFRTAYPESIDLNRENADRDRNRVRMPQPISPWSDFADCESPDGRYRAVISDASEVAMGAPTSGTLLIHDNANGMRTIATVEGCSPSLVWSSDSAALAVPRWTRDRKQTLLVLGVPSARAIAEAKGFRVLELHAFDGRIIKGIDSPIYMPWAFEFVLDDAPGS